MSEITRPRLSKEDVEKQIKAVQEIKICVAQIKSLCDCFVGKTCKTAFLNSVINLEKKCEQYTKEKVVLTDEEKKVMKEALVNFRASKDAKVLTSSEQNTDEPNAEISEPSTAEKIMSKKGKRH